MIKVVIAISVGGILIALVMTAPLWLTFAAVVAGIFSVR